MMDYESQLKAAKLNPEGADYLALRMAYTRSIAYAPYTRDMETIEQLSLALKQDNLDAALKAVQHLLDLWYLDIEAHMAADFVYVRLNDLEKSAYHRSFAKGLINSILGSGNGRTLETAFIVTDIREEYVILRLLGLRHTRQSLHQQDQNWFDMFETISIDSKEAQTIYFNINLPKRWLDQIV